LFAGLDTEKLMDIDDGSRVSPNSIYNELSAKIKQDGPKLLLDKGDEYYGAGDYANAIVYYDKSLAISPSFVAALYKKAMAYKLSGDSQNANTIFGDIIINYPDSNEAKLAKTERGY
ncbi:MAG: tetratricopeptide repeat protein, partial [Lachnospiraceae bacterium]